MFTPLSRLVVVVVVVTGAAFGGIAGSGVHPGSLVHPQLLAGFLILMGGGLAALGPLQIGLAVRTAFGPRAWSADGVGAVSAVGTRLRSLSIGFGVVLVGGAAAAFALSALFPPLRGLLSNAHLFGEAVAVVILAPLYAAIGVVVANACLTAAATAPLFEADGEPEDALWFAVPVVAVTSGWVWALPGNATAPMFVIAALALPFALGRPVSGRAALATHLRRSAEPLLAAGCVIGLVGVVRALSNLDRSALWAGDLPPHLLGAIGVVTALNWLLPAVADTVQPDEVRLLH